MTAHEDPLLEHLTEHLTVSAEELWVLIDSVAGGSRVLSGIYGREQVWWVSGRHIREPVPLAETVLIRDLLDAGWLLRDTERDYHYHGTGFPARPILLSSRARRWAGSRHPGWWLDYRPGKDTEDTECEGQP